MRAKARCFSWSVTRMYQPLKKQRPRRRGRGWGSKGEEWEGWRRRKRGRRRPVPMLVMVRAPCVPCKRRGLVLGDAEEEEVEEGPRLSVQRR
jgi:hypothetical protein